MHLFLLVVTWLIWGSGTISCFVFFSYPTTLKRPISISDWSHDFLFLSFCVFPIWRSELQLSASCPKAFWKNASRPVRNDMYSMRQFASSAKNGTRTHKKHLECLKEFSEEEQEEAAAVDALLAVGNTRAILVPTTIPTAPHRWPHKLVLLLRGRIRVGKQLLLTSSSQPLLYLHYRAMHNVASTAILWQTMLCIN